MPRRRLAVLLLVLATTAVYAQVARFQFVHFDDPHYLFEEHVAQGLSWANVRWAFTTFELANWHPLTWLSHMLDVELFGLHHPGGHHLVSAAIHLVNTLLLLGLLRRMTVQPGDDRGFWPCYFVAAMFALHPLHVESVAWVSERKDVLSMLLGLLSLWMYVDYARRGGAWRYGWCALFLALGLLVKPMLVTLPCLMLLLDYWPLGRMPTWSPRLITRRVMEKLPLLAIVAASSVVTYLAQRHGGAMPPNMSPSQRVLNAIVAYALYLRKTVWPSDLSAFYPHPYTIGYPGLSTAAVLGSALLLAGITLFVLHATRRWGARYATVGWLWFLGTLVPTIGLVQVGSQALADRYTYLPHTGLFIMIAFGAADLVGRRKTGHLARLSASLGVAVTLILVLTAIVAWRQVRTWRDTFTLAGHALALDPNNWQMHGSLGIAYNQRGDLEKAAHHFRAALALAPGVYKTQLSLGMVYLKLGEAEPARRQFIQAVALRNNDHETFYSLAMAQQALGLKEQALVSLRHALRLNPSDALSHNLAAVICDEQGWTERAIAHYRRAVELSPDHYALLNNYAWLLATHPDDAARQGQEAVALASRACELALAQSDAPALVTTLKTLAAAYAEAGDFGRAMETAGSALELAGGREPITGVLRQQLELYRAGQPMRQPPRH